MLENNIILDPLKSKIQFLSEEENKNCIKCSPFSLITSCLLIICAAIIQCIEGNPNYVTVTFLLMGVTSVIHHSRLNKWWINDIWRLLDYCAIIAFTLAMTMKFKYNKLWYFTISIILIIVIYIWSGYLNEKYIPYIHGIIHILICIVVIFLIIANKNK